MGQGSVRSSWTVSGGAGRLICQWWVMTSVKTVSEQQDLVRSSSSTTHSCVLEAWLARTLARVMEAVPWCVPPSMIPTPMFRLVSWPGVLDAERMELLESTLMLPRPHAGSTRQSPVTTELHQETSVHTSATPAMSARPGTTTRFRAERQEGLRRQVRQDLREDDRRVQQVLC